MVELHQGIHDFALSDFREYFAGSGSFPQGRDARACPCYALLRRRLIFRGEESELGVAYYSFISNRRRAWTLMLGMTRPCAAIRPSFPMLYASPASLVHEVRQLQFRVNIPPSPFHGVLFPRFVPRLAVISHVGEQLDRRHRILDDFLPPHDGTA